MPHRALVLLLACWALLLVAPATFAQSDFAQSARTWRAWADAALESPPEGMRSFPALAQRLMTLLNERRTSEGRDLAALEVDPGLERAAQAHAFDMLRRDFMAHESPEGLQPGDRVGLLAPRYIGGVGENVAEHEGLGADALDDQLGPLAVKLADGFMASPGHRENIVGADYSHHGLAAATQDDRLVVVHVFGARRAVLADPLPFQSEVGAKLPLAFEEAGGTPARFAFKAPDQATEQVVVLELSSNTVSVEPGLWRLLFMFEGDGPNVFQVTDGPFIDVE